MKEKSAALICEMMVETEEAGIATGRSGSRGISGLEPVDTLSGFSPGAFCSVPAEVVDVAEVVEVVVIGMPMKVVASSLGVVWS